MEKLESRRTIYQGRLLTFHYDKVWVTDLYKSATREWVEHCPVVAVIAQDHQGKLLVVRQWRHPVEQELIEIPAGCVDPGEAPIQAAFRELKEETGYTASEMVLVAKFATTPGCCNEILYLYEAKGLTEGEPCPDADESVTAFWVDAQELKEKAAQGELVDGKTLAALNWVVAKE